MHGLAHVQFGHIEKNDLKKEGKKDNMNDLQAYFIQVKICTAEELGEGLYRNDLQR